MQFERGAIVRAPSVHVEVLVRRDDAGIDGPVVAYTKGS